MTANSDNKLSVPPLMTAAEAAEALGISTRTVHRAIHRGELRAVKLGRLIKIHRAEVIRWANGQPLPSAPPSATN